MIYRFLDGQLPAGNAQVFEYPAENGFLVFLVQDNKRGGVLDNVAVLLQKPHAEAVKCRNSPQVLIRQLTPDTLFHFRRRLVGKGHAQNVGCRDAQHFYQIQIPCCQGFGFAGTGSGYHPDVALGRNRCLPLLGVQFFQIRHLCSASFGGRIASFQSNKPGTIETSVKIHGFSTFFSCIIPCSVV